MIAITLGLGLLNIIFLWSHSNSYATHYLTYKIKQNNLYATYSTYAVNFKASYMHLIILALILIFKWIKQRKF